MTGVLTPRLSEQQLTPRLSCLGMTYQSSIPLGNNLTQTLDNIEADKDFIAANTRAATGLLYTDDSKVKKVFLAILGNAVNTYSGANALGCMPPLPYAYANAIECTTNKWQIDLDGGGFIDLNPDGQMLDNDWRCPIEGAIHSFAYVFDVTSQITNIDGKIGIRLANGKAKQASLVVTIVTAYLNILWKY